MGIHGGANAAMKDVSYLGDEKAKPVSATRKSTSTKRCAARLNPLRWARSGFRGNGKGTGHVRVPSLKSVLSLCSRPVGIWRNKYKAVSKPKSKGPSDQVFLLSRKPSFSPNSPAKRHYIKWKQIGNFPRAQLSKTGILKTFANSLNQGSGHRERSVDKKPGQWDSVTKYTVSNGRLLFSEENRIVLWNHPISGVDGYTTSAVISGFRICNHIQSKIIFPRVVSEMDTIVRRVQQAPGELPTYQLLSPFHSEITEQKPTFTSPTHKCTKCPTEFCFNLWAISSFRTADITKFIVTVTRYVDFGECESPAEWEWMALTGPDVQVDELRLMAQKQHLEAQRSIAERWVS